MDHLVGLESDCQLFQMWHGHYSLKYFVLLFTAEYKPCVRSPCFPASQPQLLSIKPQDTQTGKQHKLSSLELQFPVTMHSPVFILWVFMVETSKSCGSMNNLGYTRVAKSLFFHKVACSDSS